MKKVVAILGSMLLAVSVANAGGGKNHGLAGIMPNLMPIVVHQGELLDLTKEQKAELAKWRKDNHSKTHARKKEIKAAKAGIREAALNGKPIAELLEMEQALGQKRIEYITGKAACRDNMKRVLNDAQWAEVIKISRHEHASK